MGRTYTHRKYIVLALCLILKLRQDKGNGPKEAEILELFDSLVEREWSSNCYILS